MPDDDDLPDDDSRPFDPDWTAAPAAQLRDWMSDAGVSSRMIAASFTRRGDPKRERAVRMIDEVLDRKPLTSEHALVLERGTGIRAGMWLALEQNYRAGLAAGKKDTTHD